MKTPAIIASLTVVGSIAYAAGSQGVAGKQPPMMPSGAQAHSMQEEMLPSVQMLQGSGTDCPTGEPLHWFLQTPHIVECSSPSGTVLGAIGGGAVDVNGDGRLEFYGRLPVGNPDVVINGAPSGTSFYLWVNRVDAATQMPQPIRDTIELIQPTFGSWVLKNFPTATNASVQLADTDDSFVGNKVAGWRDMDGDGDLDYLVRLSVQLPTPPTTRYHQIWFENTGYEKPAPAIAADLNHDGKVDGADMGLLLYAWGPNQ
jgi:hypothetical protein